MIPIPVIIFAVFLALGILINYLHHKSATKQQQTIKNWLQQNAVEFQSTAILKAETSKIGRKMNEGIWMSKCEIVVTNDAVIFFGKTRININSRPLIFTMNSEYEQRFAFAKIVMPDKINLNSFSNSIYFEFGEASFKDYLFMIRIYDVGDEIKNRIESALDRVNLIGVATR